MLSKINAVRVSYFKPSDEGKFYKQYWKTPFKLLIIMSEFETKFWKANLQASSKWA